MNLSEHQQNQLLETSMAQNLAALAHQMSPTTTSVTGNLFSLSALAALQPSMANGSMPISPSLPFIHGSGSGAVEAEAKLIEYRGEKVAGFVEDDPNESMICLPQVRALRSLGAIQPGVNRCKLISCRDFDALFDDCTNAKSASSRPGRPPKRSSMTVGSLDTNSPWLKGFKVPKSDVFANLSSKQAALSALMASNNNQAASDSNNNGINTNQTNNNTQMQLACANLGSPVVPVSVGPLMSPFSAAAAQQFVMQHMMATNSFLAQAAQNGGMPLMNGNGNGGSSNENQSNMNSVSPEAPTETLHIDESNSDNLTKNPDSHPLNLTKIEPAMIGEPKPKRTYTKRVQQHNDMDHEVDEHEPMDNQSEDGTVANEPINDEDPNQSANLASLLSSWTQGLNQNQNGAANAAAANKFNPYSSVQGLLINVLGLIELAAATARTQEEQHNNEKTEMSNLLNRERADKALCENQLVAERRQRKVYQKRWRVMKKSKDELQQRLTNVMSETHFKQAETNGNDQFLASSVQDDNDRLNNESVTPDKTDYEIAAHEESGDSRNSPTS